MNSRLLTASRSRNTLTVLRSRNMLTRAAILAAACILSTAAAWAQAPAAAATSVSVKVGVINFRAAVGNTAEGKLAEAELQSQIAPRRTEIENLNKQINDLRQRLQAGQGKISPDEEARLTREGQRLTTQLDRKNTEYQEDLNAALGDIFERIGRKMNDVLDRYGRENGFSVVFDSSAQSTPILYGQAPALTLSWPSSILFQGAPAQPGRLFFSAAAFECGGFPAPVVAGRNLSRPGRETRSSTPFDSLVRSRSTIRIIARFTATTLTLRSGS